MTETDGTAALARHGYTLTKRTPQHERYDTMPQSACVKFMVVGGRWCGKVESIGANAIYAPLGLLKAVVARLGELDRGETLAARGSRCSTCTGTVASTS